MEEGVVGLGDFWLSVVPGYQGEVVTRFTGQEVVVVGVVRVLLEFCEEVVGEEAGLSQSVVVEQTKSAREWIILWTTFFKLVGKCPVGHSVDTVATLLELV